MRTKHASHAFTLMEVLISMSLATVIMLALLSTYLYLGRTLVKLGNLQILESKSRLALSYLRKDIELASAVSSPADTSVTLTVPSGSVTYNYANGTLTRTATFGAFQTNELLKNDCTSFDFNYYSTTGTAPLTGTNLVPISIKRIEFSFTLQRGNGDNGTAAEQQTVSPRYLLKNR